MVSRRTRSQNTLGTRLVEIERQLENEASARRGTSTEDLREFVEQLSSRIVDLESVNFRVGNDRPHLEDAYPQVLSGRGEEVSDWNDATLAGWYWGNAALHSPAESNGWTVGTVFYHGSSDRVIQEVFDPGFADPDSDSAGWRRVRVDGSWSAWTEIVSGGATQLSGPWPKAPTGVSLVSNKGFYTNDGKAQTEVSFSWSGVTQDTVGKPMVVDLYEVWVWRGTQTGYQRIASESPEAKFDLTTPGVSHKAKIRARGANGAWGEFSSEISFTPAYPEEVPLPPTTPIVYSEAKQAVVRWDGSLDRLGAPEAPRPGFRHVYVERATSSSGPWFAVGQPLADPGESVIPDEVGLTVWFRLVAVNVLGVLSSPSVSVSVTIKGVALPDLGTDVTDTIDDAKNTANTALKKVTTSEREPTPSDAAGMADGAMWYQYAPNGDLLGFWRLNSTTWEPLYVGSGTLAPNSVTTEKLADELNTALNTAVLDSEQAKADSAAALESVLSSVSSVVPEYAVSNSETVAPTSGWSAASPARTPGTFIWTRTVITYVDDTSETSAPALMTGNSGTSGAPGRGMQSTVTTYQVGSSGTTAPSGSWTSSPGATSPGQFLWTRTVITWTDDTTSTAYSVSAHGATGPAGTAGKGISATTITYQKSTSGTTAPTGTWSDTVPSLGPGEYLWTRTVTSFTDSTSTTAYSVGRSGVDGANGAAGAAGADGLTSYLHTAYATNSTGTAGFSTTDPTGKTYLGTYTDFTAADSSDPAEYTWVLIQGPQGATGNTGATGKGISSSSVFYQVSSSGTVVPTGTWVTSVPAASPGQFIWTRTTITFTDGATQVSYSTALQGATGAAGAPAPIVSLTATTQVLTSPATGGATSPATSVVTGASSNTTISSWQYSVDGAAFSATVPTGVTRSGNVVTITGTTMTARTITVRMADAAGVADTMTVAKVADGAAGAQGPAGSSGTDAYTVLLSNESHVFAGSTSAALAGSTTSSVIAYKGATAVPATIGTITGQVSGLTTAVTNNGTTNATITVTVTTALTTQSGTLTVPVTVDGNSFTKTIAWSVARTGATGSTGGTGATGVGVSSVTPYFLMVGAGAAVPAKPTTNPPTGGWTLAEPGYTSSTELYRTELVVYTNGTFAYTNVTKVSSYVAASEANLKADALRLRGSNLITNGNAALGNNTNFSGWTLETGDQPTGTFGAFYPGTSAASTRVTDDLIPVNPSSQYLMSVKVKQASTGVSSRFYLGLAPYDADGLAITPSFYMEQPGTRTTLAADLKPGDTTVQLTSAANWAVSPGAANSHLRRINIWNYTDARGKKWPAGTYTRNTIGDAYADGGIVGNTITLRTPHTGGLIPAGTAVSNGSSGGTYMYAPGITNALLPSDGTWTDYVATAPFGGIHENLALSATTAFPIPTAFVQVVALVNYSVTGGTSKQLYAGFSLSDADAALQYASNAVTVANLADAKAAGMVKASATDPGHQAGRIWLVLNGAGQLIGMKTSNGSVWSSYLIMADQILVPSSVGTVSIANGAITASKITITDFMNYFQDPTWTDTSYVWTPWTKIANVGIEKNGTGTQVGNYSPSTDIPVKPGDKYWFTATRTNLAGTVNGEASLYVQRLSSAKSVLGTSKVLSMTAPGKYEGTETVPANTAFLRIGFYTEATMPTATKVRISDVEIRRMTGGELIVDGSVLARHVSMDSGFADKFWANTANIGKVKVDMLEPNIGEKINISANDGVRIVAGDAANAMSKAIEASALAGGAGSIATYASEQARKAQEAAAAAADEGKKTRSVFDFDDTGLHISQPGGIYSLHLNNEGITINQGVTTVSLWNAGQMIVDKFVGSEVVLANHKIESRGTRTVFRSM